MWFGSQAVVVSQGHASQAELVLASQCWSVQVTQSGQAVTHVQGCALYDNWWPMLTAFFYVLIPMPYLFFGSGGGDAFISSSSDMELGCALSVSLSNCARARL